MKESKFSNFVFNSKINTSLVASPNISVNVDLTQDNYSVSFKHEGSVGTFPLGHYYNFKALFELEDRLKHTDYHVLSGTNKEFILIKELLNSSVYERAIRSYKENPEGIFMIDGEKRIIKRDENDALIYAINDKKDQLNEDLLQLAQFSSANFIDQMYKESEDVIKSMKKYNHDFYCESLLLINEQILKKMGISLHTLPFIERAAVHSVDSILEKNIAWLILNKKTIEFRDILKEDMEFNESVMKDKFVEKSFNSLEKLYDSLQDVSSKTTSVIDKHFNRVLNDYAGSSLMKKETQDNIMRAKKLIDNKYSQQNK